MGVKKEVKENVMRVTSSYRVATQQKEQVLLLILPSRDGRRHSLLTSI